MRSEGPVPRHDQILPFDYLLRELFTDRTSLLVCLFAIVVAVRYVRSPWRSVPPGPRGLPILGNALQVRDKRWLFGQDCKDAFRVFFSFCMARELRHSSGYIVGDAMYLNAFGQPLMVISSLKPTTELLGRRATVYSDRPRMIVANEILSGGFVGIIRYGDLSVICFSKRRRSHPS